MWGATIEIDRTDKVVIVSIHAPRVGRDRDATSPEISPPVFQSTRPVWGATAEIVRDSRSGLVSIHAPRVGRDGFSTVFMDFLVVSIHAPRVGRDFAIQ